MIAGRLNGGFACSSAIFEEIEVHELLDVVAVAETVVAHAVAIVPEFMNDSATVMARNL